jgi:MFS family permease
MAMAVTQGTLSDTEHSAQLRKAVIASTIGTAIEWYDFFLYGTAAGLIFGKLYFPNEDALTATLAAFGTYFIGFVGRPIGAAIFGHYGDRIGRKATLIATLLCMGIATFLIAFVPTYASIGIWGAVILTVLRMLQGIGVGGEWGGSVLLAMEWSRTHGQRGLVASWPQFGVPCGLFLANLAVLAFSQLSGDQFAVWGWRIPFALSIILVGVGLWIRLGILETPVFQQLLDTRKIEKAPIVEVFKKHPKEIILSALLRMAEQAPFYIFGMADTAIPALVFIAIVLSLIPHDMQYGPQAALIAEAFTPRLRYSGASLGYQLASVIAGGPAPLIATALFAHYHSGYAISFYILACSVISLAAASFMPDYTGRDISAEYDD